MASSAVTDFVTVKLTQSFDFSFLRETYLTLYQAKFSCACGIISSTIPDLGVNKMSNLTSSTTASIVIKYSTVADIAADQTDAANHEPDPKLVTSQAATPVPITLEEEEKSERLK